MDTSEEELVMVTAEEMNETLAYLWDGAGAVAQGTYTLPKSS